MNFNHHGEELYCTLDHVNNFFSVLYFGKTLPREGYIAHQSPMPYHLIEFVIDGLGWVEYNGVRTPVKRGDLFFINKDSSAVYGVYDENYFTKYFLAVYGSLADSMISSFYDNSEVMIRQLGERTDEVESIFEELKVLLDGTIFVCSSSELSRKMSDAANIFFRILSCSVGESKFSNNDTQSALSSRLRLWLDEHATENITLNDAAEAFHISVAHIIRIFKSTYAITPKRYLISRRIAHARLLLANEELSISDIAEKLYFKDTSYFAAVFKRYTGYTPTEDRARTRLMHFSDRRGE